VLMDNAMVCGVGNIYANESLFRAGIHPARHAGRISRQRYQRLVEAVRVTLRAAIRAGGSTLRDFVHATAAPAIFSSSIWCTGARERSARPAGRRSNRCGSGSARRSTVRAASAETLNPP
jgi:formamidopyrimidine-DNA glycosylase